MHAHAAMKSMNFAMSMLMVPIARALPGMSRSRARERLHKVQSVGLWTYQPGRAIPRRAKALGPYFWSPSPVSPRVQLVQVSNRRRKAA